MSAHDQNTSVPIKQKWFFLEEKKNNKNDEQQQSRLT